MDNALVSILIPTYNRAALIAETLDSVLAQTYPNWECIIVDDGSVDHTAAVIAPYLQDSRFQFCQRPGNRQKGANACRNFAFERCKGQYVNWIDSDDRLHPDFIKSKMSAFAGGHYDVVCSKTVITEEDITKVIKYENRTTESDDYLNDYIIFKFKLFNGDPLWKRAFLTGVTLYDEALLKGQDYDFHIRMLARNPALKIIDEYLYYYRSASVSISNDFSDEVALSMFWSNHKRINSDIFPRLNVSSRLALFDYHTFAVSHIDAIDDIIKILLRDFKKLRLPSMAFGKLYFKFFRKYLTIKIKSFKHVSSI